MNICVFFHVCLQMLVLFQGFMSSAKSNFFFVFNKNKIKLLVIEMRSKMKLVTQEVYKWTNNKNKNKILVYL